MPEGTARPLQASAGVVIALGLTQTLAWASSYYLPAMLAAPMARELDIGTPMVFAAFSLALLVSAAVGPAAGRLVDRRGGRPVLMGSNLLFALALILLAGTNDIVGLFVTWALMGVAMGSGLYETAFAALVRLDGLRARSAITGITLMAGFASTVGWPLSAWLETELGWRGACAVWAGIHLLVGLPLNARLPSTPKAKSLYDEPSTHLPSEASGTGQGVTMALLALVFAITWFISTAMASHLPTLLGAAGLPVATAIGLAALVGPAQVAVRLLDFAWLRHLHPLLTARVAALTHTLGAFALMLMGPALAAPFVLLHGAGNGILTIAKGSLPLVIFGANGYGARQGLLMLPARIAQAAAPLTFGHVLERSGVQALWLTLVLSLVATAALLRITPERTF